jgi:ABC-type branched-subunit amino acid transport system ATPase component
MTRGLLVRGIDVAFGGVAALAGAGIEVRPGRVSGLIGRNGSGKSTLFNCITGFVVPVNGQVMLDGLDITRRAPHQIVREGIARTFQTPRVDFRMTVREAVLCGTYATVAHGFIASALKLPRARLAERNCARATDELLDRMGLAHEAGRPLATLSMGRLRMVDVARALAAGARYLLLDEPAAGISREEQVTLAREVRKLAACGIGVLLVEHNFSLIRQLCDRITVLDGGRVLLEGDTESVMRDERVVLAYLGTRHGEEPPS